MSVPSDADRAPRGQTFRLEVPAFLPDVDHAGDPCIERVRKRVETEPGVTQAHVVGGGDRDPAQPGTIEAELCLHYDPDEVTLERLEHLVEDEGGKVADRYRHERLRVHGMDCTDCSLSIEHVLARHPGVHEASVSYAAERMHVEWDTEQTTLEEILERVESMGYTPVLDEHDHAHGDFALWTSLVGGLLLAVGFVGETLAGLDPTIAIALYAGAYVTAGWDAARHAIGALSQRTLDIDVLMVLAAAGAAGLGLWAEGALLLVLFSLGHALEHRAMDRARDAIGELGRLAPETARLEDGDEVPVDEVAIGDRILVRPGERVPVDGDVLEGESALDESPITGEHAPAAKAPGDEVYAGTVNGEGRLLVEATRAGHDSTIARVAELVDDAQTRKSGVQRTSERFERVLTPSVLVLVALVMLGGPLVALAWSSAPGWLTLTWTDAAVRGIAVLVAAAPCALAISTPSAILAALGTGARSGVLVKGGDVLETTGQVDAVAIDKTGTLTEGTMTVGAIVATPEADEDEVLQAAASLEHDATHPIARAIVRRAQGEGLVLAEASDLTNRPGRGVTGTIDGEGVRVGNRAHVDEPPRKLLERAERLENDGRTVVYVQTGEQVVGLIALTDRLREGAREAIAELRDQGVERIAMLTGDHEPAALAIAREAGVDEVHAELMPEEKTQRVEAMAREHGTVAMVGDGVNDAPAMAAAHVGIAMGARGSATALETADVALMGDRLSGLPKIVTLARRTRRIVRENLAISLAVIAVLVPLAAGGLAGIAPAIVAHEGSTLLVVANALRLVDPVVPG